MVELRKQDIKEYSRQSSKGNQLKWNVGNIWYKADYTGYEGLAEYVVSRLLQYSSLKEKEYVLYETEDIHYEYTQFFGCKSYNFLPKGWRLITLERLFQITFQESLNKAIYSITDSNNRISFLVEQTIRITGLKDFGKYMSKLMTIDAFFLNEDRHTHNIAVLLDEEGNYHECPVFDHGASLLADTKMDYPLAAPLSSLMQKVQAKTFCPDFDVQLDSVEHLYGQQLHFTFGRQEVENILEQEPYYPQEIKDRVYEIIVSQCRKYQYLF